MRPLVLSMQAFGPFIEKQTIDFTSIKPGLFLISGQTGSGKTTIFDALSFALFGQASGESRQTKNFRSDFADSDLATEVYLKFTHNNREYEIRRSPSYERPKLRGEGTTIQPARAELLFSDGRKPIDRPTEVDQAIVELLGVDYDHFRQTSMLAQGEFSKLLTADSDQRATIFREIFQTQHIQIFQDQLKQKAKAKRDELNILWAKYDQAVSYLEFTLEDLILAQNQFEEDLQNKIRPQEDPSVWIRAQKQADQAVLVANQAGQDKVKTLLEEKRKQLEEGEKWLEKEKTWEKLDLDLKTMEEAAKDFPRRKEKLKLAQDVLYKLKPLADLYASKKNDLEIASKAKEELTLQLAELEETYKKDKTAYDDLGQEEEQRKNQDQEIRSLESTLPSYQKLSQALSERNQLQADLKDLEETIQKTRGHVAEMTKQIEEKKNLTKALSDLLVQEAEQAKVLEQVNENLQKVSNSIIWLESFSREEQVKDKYKERVDQAYASLKAKVKDKNQIEESYMAQEAAFLALSLKKDEPCPVCGSLEHPSPAQAQGGEVSKENLSQARSDHAKAEDHYQNIRSEYIDHLVSLDHKWSEQRDLIDLDQELLAYEDLNQLATEPKFNYFVKLINECKKKELGAQDLVSKETQALAETQRKLKVSQRAEEELEILNEDLLELQVLLKDHEDQASQVKQEIGALEATIQTRREGLVHENLAEAEQALVSLKASYKTWLESLELAKKKAEQTKERLNQAKEKLNHSSGSLESLEKEFDKRQSSFAQGLKDLNLADEKAFYDHLLTPEDLEDKDKELKSSEEALKELRITVKNFLEDWDRDLDRPDLKSLSEELQNLSKQSDALLSEAKDIENRIEKNESTRQRLADQTQVLKELESNYRDLVEITDIANGSRKGGLKRDFENYVQSYYFRQILNMANSRLSVMTGGRYQLLPQREVEDKRRTTGLDISVLDLNTGKERPLSTLSGGESFMTALALALGLSDVAQAYQGGLVIETLFIDEGFGSLDRASLSEAVRVLEDLGESRYHCGIISHVEELQDEIDQQIRVVKEVQGSRLEFNKV